MLSIALNKLLWKGLNVEGEVWNYELGILNKNKALEIYKTKIFQGHTGCVLCETWDEN